MVSAVGHLTTCIYYSGICVVVHGETEKHIILDVAFNATLKIEFWLHNTKVFLKHDVWKYGSFALLQQKFDHSQSVVLHRVIYGSAVRLFFQFVF